jgi:GMP synthase (glutamine-hydrolysing)
VTLRECDVTLREGRGAATSTIVGVKPFLLLSSRPEDEAADDEYAAVMRMTDLAEHELHRYRMESAPLPPIDLDDYSGVLVGGSPYNSSDPVEVKSDVQHRVEAELRSLLDEMVARDFPFLGACYGIGTLGVHQGGVIDRTYSEPVSAVDIKLTDAGMDDPLLAGIPPTFSAFVGHKEACSTLPSNAVLLAGSATCPVQMFRVKTNLYATQFHPELDQTGILTRVRVYREYGYFPADEVDALVERLTAALVTEPTKILTNFVTRYS